MALAGRVGASIAAELGTMKVTEQVDALETLAYDRNSYLVVPRVLAATLMFPVVTAFAMAVGVAAGWITAINLLDLSTHGVPEGTQAVLPVQGHLVRPGEERQLRRRGGADGVPAGPRREGRRRRAWALSTTRAVVLGCEAILVLDAFWALVLL